MVILGNKYNFTELEAENIEKQFQEITSISYKDKDSKEIIDSIEEILKNKDRHLIILNTFAVIPDKLIIYLTNLELNGISFISIEHFLENYMHKCYIPDNHTDISFLEKIKPYTKWQYIQKRTIDYFGIFWLFFFSWPLMLYSAYRIKKESPDGSIFFKQKRVGKNGVEFECVKFRSMRTDVEFFNHYTQENDPRIFSWGKIMRKTRLDELPQIWNILKGEMHLIGPRAEWIELVKNYEKSIPYYNQRHLVAPGITGWAQVNYPYGQNLNDTKQKLMYDLYYIKYWSIKLELKIVWMTAMTVIGKKGI